MMTMAVMMLRGMVKEKKVREISLRTTMTVTVCVVSSSGVFHVLGTESQGCVGFDDHCNDDVEDYAEAGREVRQHWDENNNNNDDLILSGIFYLFKKKNQLCGTMGTES